uniref:Protein kinase-3 n=1 Tax=Oryza coarctata TaxID=77588 RepID=E0CW94_ORYCO|nr:protein kinase-3 [Oryza coarctata]
MDPTDLTFRLLEEITDGFSEERKLGKGAYGTVYKGERKNGDEIAVKMLHNDTLGFDDKKFENEFQNLMRLKHPNIVRLVAYCYETQHKHAEHKGRIVFAAIIHRALCFEYMPGGSLQNHLSDEFHGLDWPTRYKIIKGTCQGLNYLHEGMKPPIYHLDLKPDNILLDKNMVPKLADFGLSKLFSEDKTKITQTPIGTIGYLPPEYIEKNVVSNKLDIFSLGVVMLKILAGPRGRSRSAEMSSQEFTSQVLGNWTTRLLETRNVSSLQAYLNQVKTCTEIALKCLDIDRHKRPNIVDIINWINENEAMIGQDADKPWTKGPVPSDHHEKPPSSSNVNLDDTQENQEDDHSNSCSKEKEEEHEEVHQIIPMEHPSVPIDVHLLEPWILTSNMFGSVDIMNYNTQDGFIRVYTYESPVRQVKRFKAHSLDITSLDVHRTEPYLLSAGSMDPIKLWDWNKGWECIKMFDMQAFQTVQQIKFNPHDTHKFAVTSILDAQIWDCKSRTCVQTLIGHMDCVSSVCSHPDIPILLTGSFDETVRLWNSTTFKLEGVLDFELGKVISIVCLKGSKRVVIGHEAGLVITEIRHEQAGPSNK